MLGENYFFSNDWLDSAIFYSMRICIFLTFLALFVVNILHAQYRPVKHRELLPGEVPVTGPGSYAEPGTTYVLVNDIVADRSAIFLGKDVMLDLNGYTISYAAGNYKHIQNGGFEEGIAGWDLSKAPGAKLMNTADIHVFVGDKLMSLQSGDEIRSSYVELPLANRSYIAMVGITGRHFTDPEMKGDLKNEMKLSVFVEDENGNNVKVVTKYKDTTMVSCPVEARSPRLGGGFIFAHLNGLPAGKYRIRIRADTDCLVDEIDIRPAKDVGIGIVEKTSARGHNDHLYRSEFAAFFDYTADAVTGKPLAGIPIVKGRGTVTICNGIIENAAKGAISWGIQSTADDVEVIVDNVHFKTEGINTTAIDVPQATITHCRFDVENPFIINRHYSNFYAVDLRGSKASRVSYSEFYGGQGCLVFKGKHSSVHHNYFVNNQAVTNHYSIMAMGDSSRIFENRIEPKRGSGIEIYSRKYIDIFNNTIKIKSSPPTCEYGREEYSANAIRIADYRARPGSPDGAYGNRVYNNKISITAINFESPESYVPLSWAVFYSASAGDNDIFGNDIEINHTAPGTKALATAFFITGGTRGYGGNFYNNRIRSNVPAIWIAGKYGGTIKTRVANNQIIKTSNAPADFKPFRMGFTSCKDCIAKEVVISSNEIVNDHFDIQVEGKGHSYQVKWNLTVQLKDNKGQPVVNTPVSISDAPGNVVFSGTTDNSGKIVTDLVAYYVTEQTRTDIGPFTVTAGATSVRTDLTKNTKLQLLYKPAKRKKK